MEFKKYFKEERIIGFSVCLFGLFPLLPEGLKGLPVIILIVCAIFFYLTGAKKKINLLKLIKLSSLYLINLFSVFYTGSFYFPINKMETTLALLIIPIAFSLINVEIIKENTKVFLFRTFILSTSILTIISLLFYQFNNLFSKNLFKVNSFRKLIIEVPVFGDHPIYVSLFLGISILFAITCFKGKSKIEKTILLSACVFNIFHMLLLSSKGVIIAILLSLILFVFLNIKESKQKIALSFGVLGLFLASILLFPNTERRFREIGKRTTYTELHVNNSSSIRIAIYECAISKIRANPLIGYGWGLGDKVLIDCFKEKSNYLFEQKFNSHNQFLGYYLDGGIIALLLLILFLYNQFKSSIYKKEYLFTSLILFYGFLMLTENILNRQSGVIIFIFLVSFFDFYKGSSK